MLSTSRIAVWLIVLIFVNNSLADIVVPTRWRRQLQFPQPFQPQQQVPLTQQQVITTVNGQTIPMANTGPQLGTGQGRIDNFLFAFALPQLMMKLDGQDRASLEAMVQGLGGNYVGSQIYDGFQRWVNTLTFNSRQQIIKWERYLEERSQSARQMGNLIALQQPSAVLRAWQQLQQLAFSTNTDPSRFSTQINSIYSLLSISDARALDQIFKSVYGFSLIEMFIPTINQTAFQQLYHPYSAVPNNSPTSGVLVPPGRYLGNNQGMYGNANGYNNFASSIPNNQLQPDTRMAPSYYTNQPTMSGYSYNQRATIAGAQVPTFQGQQQRHGQIQYNNFF